MASSWDERPCKEDAATLHYLDVQVIVTRSAGSDGAVVVFVDTAFEPNGSDNGPGLRILLNDHDTYEGVPWTPDLSD